MRKQNEYTSQLKILRELEAYQIEKETGFQHMVEAKDTIKEKSVDLEKLWGKLKRLTHFVT